MKNLATAAMGLGMAAAAWLLFFNNGVIENIGPFVTNNSTRAYRFEPSSAAGTNWAMSWQDVAGPATDWFVSAWNGSAWNTPTSLSSVIPGTQPWDTFLSWDSVMGRFVFVCLDNGSSSANSNVWYGYSTDQNGTAWVVGNGGRPVFAASLASWDYPSVGVDASGRIVVGAYSLSSPNGFWSVVSSDHGNSFSGINLSGTTGRVAAASGSNPFRSGRKSRIIATDSKFMAFVAEETGFSSGIPVAIERYESVDGINWGSPSDVFSFAAPPNNSPANITCGPNGCGAIYYSPGVDAKGSTSGAWVMTVPVNFNGASNIMMCASSRGCGLVNAANDDEFLAGTSVSTDGRFWVSYFTYSSLGIPATAGSLPLIKQSIFFPFSSGGGVGTSSDSDIDPSYWMPDQFDHCPKIACFSSGDFATIASNPFAGVTTPYTKHVPDGAGSDGNFNHMQQIFSIDPQGPPPPHNFKPNTIWFPGQMRNIAHLAKALRAEVRGPQTSQQEPKRNVVPPSPPPASHHP